MRADHRERREIEDTVLRATEGLLAEGATFAELDIGRSPREAGISRPAFYFYFRDKRELLMRLTAEVSELLSPRPTRGSRATATTREALGGIAALYREHGALLRAIVEVSTYDARGRAFWRELVGRFVVGDPRPDRARAGGGGARPGDAFSTAFALCWIARAGDVSAAGGQAGLWSARRSVDSLGAIFERGGAAEQCAAGRAGCCSSALVISWRAVTRCGRPARC